ncbi:penicillin-binding protein 1B [Glaciecola sp. KUL10]|uniref:penicillin-binding protein 1B n=1 Tax=Glaciecola sp. (strain KUL10) TaxID=2161813 RepID=UPI000D785422|nr:penicillin-binding protein 1B [Glaciecola sp. KUL10]GBL03704.1 penicillin-binding protein 1B [Glaciecola sp. KUL10]
MPFKKHGHRINTRYREHYNLKILQTLLSLLLTPFRWIKRHFFKLFVVASVGLCGYLVFLDAHVKKRFEGNKWEVPVQVYARPLLLNIDQEISIQELKDELDLLGYRRVPSVEQTGEFSQYAGQIEIKRRAFHFPGQDEDHKHLMITWDSNRIKTIRNLDTRRSMQQVRLEPWLVARMVNGLEEDRMLVSNDDIPVLLKQALITVEDRDFYQHFGVAPLSIARALVANLTAGRTVQGGSTLTQQLAKNFFLTRERSYTRKLKEALMALVIDFRYSKEEILHAYINEVFLGQNGAVAVHGFGLASHFYFNKPLPELTVPEIATLVGMVKGPSYYHPKRQHIRAIERRNLVLRLLFEAEQLTKNEYQVYVNQPLKTTKNISLASGKHPAFMQKVRQELTQVVGDDDALMSGIKVFTTLDINAQRRAEQALRQQVDKISKARNKPKLEGAMVVSDIKTGGIRAIVGGKQTQYAGFNRALNAQRPIGSLVKPAVYLTALEDPANYNLATLLEDKPVKMKSTGGQLWEPLNADKKFRGQVPLIDAITKSYNVPSVKLGMTVGLGEVAYTLQRLGVNASIKQVPALTLGALDLSPLQVNQMYQTIANNGLMTELHSLSAVSTHDDILLWQRQLLSEQRSSAPAAYLINYALHKVTLDGTAKQIKRSFPSINMAGKTGTTNDYRDSWFAGFDRNLVTSIWMGADDNTQVGLSGASGAMQVFIAFQKQQSPKNLSRRFPAELGIAHFDKATGSLSAPGCGDIMSVPAILSALPATSKPCAGQKATPELKPKKKSFWEKLFG